MKINIPRTKFSPLIVLGIFTILINLLLLIPSPFEQIKVLQALEEQQIVEQVNNFEGTKADQNEIKKNIEFTINRKTNAIWLRWASVAIFCSLQMFCFISLLKNKQNTSIANVGIFCTSVIYLLCWALSIATSQVASASILDGFVQRILTEFSVNQGFWATRYFLLNCLNPLLCIFILGLYQVNRFNPSKVD